MVTQKALITFPQLKCTPHVPMQLDALLALAERGPVTAQYLALKSTVCCGTGADLMVQWILLTGAGVCCVCCAVHAVCAALRWAVLCTLGLLCFAGLGWTGLGWAHWVCCGLRVSHVFSQP